MEEQDAAAEEAFLAMIRAGWARPDSIFRRVFTSAFIPDATEQQMEWMDELQRTSTNTDNAVASRIARHHTDVSDVLPAIAAGSWGVHVPHDLTWAYEHAEAPREDKRFRKIADLSEVASLIDEIERG